MFLEITIRIPSVKIFTNFSKNFNQHFTLSLEKIKKVKTKKKSDHEVNKIYPLPRGRGKKQKLAKSSLFFSERTNATQITKIVLFSERYVMHI